MSISDEMSGFERCFEEMEPGYAMVSIRNERFDLEHSLFFSPLRYDPVSLGSVPDAPPSVGWVKQSFLRFVRAEYSGYENSYEARIPEFAEEGQCDFLEIATRLRNSLEQKLVFGDLISEILDGTNVFSTKERLYRLFTSNEFGRLENEENLNFGDFSEMLKNIRVGLRCVIPGLPFRDQNRFRTDNNPEEATMAEAVFLVRLHCIALAAYQVLPTGADIVVLADGSFFRELFNISPENVNEYLASVRRLRNRLNISGTVQIVDLQTVVEKFDNGTGLFSTIVNNVAHTLHEACEPGVGDIAEAMASMETGFRRNFTTRGLLASNQDVESWLNGEKVDAVGLPNSSELRSRTIAYAARNLTLKWFDVIDRMFPTAVRATMHAKPGQLGFPRLGETFPWNGVAVLEADSVDISAFSIYPLDQAAKKFRSLRPIRAESGIIVYYEGIK